MAAKRITVEATWNLDWINLGEIVEVDEDPGIRAQIDAGYLKELPKSQARRAGVMKAGTTGGGTPEVVDSGD